MGNMFKLLKSHVRAAFMTPTEKDIKKICFVYLDNDSACAFLTHDGKSFLNVAKVHSLNEILPCVCVCVCVCVCLIVCDRVTSALRWPRSELGCSAQKKKWERNLWLYRLNESNYYYYFLVP